MFYFLVLISFSHNLRLVTQRLECMPDKHKDGSSILPWPTIDCSRLYNLFIRVIHFLLFHRKKLLILQFFIKNYRISRCTFELVHF